MLSRAAGILIVGALALSPGMALANGDSDALEPLVIEMAGTPGMHTALAGHYRAEAQEARAEKRRHERMGEAYRRRKVSLRWIEERRHCERLAKKYAEVAEEYEALARLHEEEAKGTE